MWFYSSFLVVLQWCYSGVVRAGWQSLQAGCVFVTECVCVNECVDVFVSLDVTPDGDTDMEDLQEQVSSVTVVQYLLYSIVAVVLE
jgi:hypothetical protein